MLLVSCLTLGRRDIQVTRTKSHSECTEDDDDEHVFDLETDYHVTGRPASKKASLKIVQAPHKAQGRAPQSPLKSPSAKYSAFQQSTSFAREQYIRVNCKFFVLKGTDCSDVAADPNTIASWDVVEYLQIQVHDEPVCPICLGPPLAPKMTKCGHIYCWSDLASPLVVPVSRVCRVCILQHLATSDKTWHNCPLCDDFVYEKDLRSVDFLHLQQQPQPGASFRFALLKRDKASTYPVVVVEYPSFKAARHPSIFEVCMTFLSLLLIIIS